MRPALGAAGIACFVIACSGCLGADGPPAPDRSVPVALNIGSCHGIEAFTTVSEATAAAHVPAGFSPDVAGGRVTVILGAMVCPDNALARAFLAIRVIADDPTLAVEGASLFWEPEHIVTAGQAGTAAFEAMSANITYGNVSIETTPTGIGAHIDVPGGSHAISPLAGTVLPTAAEAALLPPFREYAAADGGYVYLEGGFSGDVTGATAPSVVAIETAPNTVSRALFGEATTALAIGFEGYGYPDAHVGFMAYP